MAESVRGRALSVTLTAILVVAALVVAWRIADVLLLGVAAGLLALLLDTLATLVARWTRLPRGWALCLTCVALAALVAGVGALLAPSVSQQVDELGERLPQAWARVTAWLDAHGWGRRLLESARSGGEIDASLGRAFGLVGTSFGLLAQALLLVVMALYLAAQPTLYRDGALALAPGRLRGRMLAAMERAGESLRWWLLGQVCGMAMVGAFTTLGLWALGVPMALVLGIIAGILNFIPNIGPWLAAVPGALIALTLSPKLAVWAMLVYLGVQIVESYVVMPLIHQRTVRLAPAVLIFSQLALGVLLGPIALALAAPLLVIAVASVEATREAGSAKPEASS